MKTFKKESAFFKVLHVCALYAVVLQSVFPLGQAFAATSTVQPSMVLMPKMVQDKSVSTAKVVDTESVHTNQAAAKAHSIELHTKQAITLVGGPGQSESSGFSLGSTDDMVDKFTGDFSYSIPLADIEGYPIVLNYNSNIVMNSEATWVGLGWDLNVGAVSREMRGLPDEFNGEQTILKTFNQAPDNGTGFKFGGYVALAYEKKFKVNDLGMQAGIQAQLTALKGKYNNTYLGIGKTFDFGLQATPSIGTSGIGLFVAPSFGIGYTSDTKRGVGTQNHFGLSGGVNGGTSSGIEATIGGTVGNSFHSRQGLVEKTISGSATGGNTGENWGMVAGYSTTSVIPYGTLTSIPSVRMNSYGRSINGGGNIYAGVKKNNWVLKVGFLQQDFYSNSSISLNSNKQIVHPALGYFHSGKYTNFLEGANEMGTTTPLMDFNRTNDQEYSVDMKNLAFSIQTYDIFRANAMGLGATFRGRREDVGTYRDATLINSNKVGGINVSAGAVFETGVSTSLEMGLSGVAGGGFVASGNFKKPNGNNVVDFVQEATGSQFDSPVYFKGVGESTPENLADFDELGGFEPTYFAMQKSSDEKNVELSPTSYTVSTNTTPAPVRAMYYRPFTSLEYTNVEGYYHSYKNFASARLDEPINRLQSLEANNRNFRNHLSAVEIVNTDGIKYVFGVPAYDITSAQVTFSVTGLTDPNADGIVTYAPLNGTYEGDNSTENMHGPSNYFDKTTVPAYPHSFLLSEMLSSDYIDRTSNGPSMDDIGSYYKFNYTRVFGGDNGNYKWRFPYEANAAYYNRGLLGTNLDDLANYSYGEKEIWYTHSVESKNLIAEFELLDREDACGVLGENGGIDVTQKLKKLDKIKIYNRSERLGPNGANAVPLQIIEFEYTYELCKNNPANSNAGSGNAGGKLTLKKIRSYSGKSEEMGLYTYEFEYDQNASSNKDFSYITDAWGNYKAPSATKPIDIFPYAEQNESTANTLAQNWKLIKIQTPTHGTLEIEYEADSYATVQDRRAMQHIDVVGMTNLMDLIDIQGSSTWNYATATNIYTDFHKNYSSNSYTNWPAMDNYMQQFANLDRTNVPNNVVVFKLSEGISGTQTFAQASEKVLINYFTDQATAPNSIVSELLLKLHVQVKEGVTELIPTFGKISNNFGGILSIGVMPKQNAGSDYQYGYVILDPTTVDNDDTKKRGYVFNSLQKSAIEFIRRNLPDVVYNASVGSSSSNSNLILDRAVALKKEDINLLMNRYLWARDIIIDFTTVRLYEPRNKKFGGVGRVKSLTYRDNWTEISSETTIPGVYKWEYEYPERPNTSGNAAFEPQGMLDECALYQWDTYINKAEKYPDETKFTPTPAMAILYPSPVIGYEKVKVSIYGTANKGYSISEFHTSFNHPVDDHASDIQKLVHIDKPGNKFTGRTTDKFGYSQGFVIATNDFHGKPKQMVIYAIAEQMVDNNLVLTPVIQSRSTYNYAELTDKQPMIDRNANITMETTSQEIDIHADTRYVVNSFTYTDVGVSLKLKFVVAPPAIIPFISPILSKSSRVQSFYSSALIKHINRSAIVTSIKTEQLGSVNTAQNVLYDYYTGNVIVSSLKDEYEDPLFSVNAPAHWYYKELRELYSSQDAVVNVTIAIDGTISAMDHVLTPGDIVRFIGIVGTPSAWIAKHSATTDGTLYLMNGDGTASAAISSAGTYQVKIEKSNRDNRLNETMQSAVTKKDPITTVGNSSSFVFPNIEVISMSAVTYRDRNNVKCGTPNAKENPNNNNEVTLNDNINPYLYGIRGDLVLDGQYAWQEERLNAAHPYKTRFDGTYTTCVPFYKLNGSTTKWNRINEAGHPNNIPADPYQKWRKMGEITVFNEFGAPIESKDQLDIYSAALYGYDRTFNLVPVAQAVNARQQEIAFDGFEDYSYHTTLSSPILNNVPHFDFKDVLSANVQLDQTRRHSGLTSLKLSSNATATVVRTIGAACLATSVIDPRCNCFKVQECACIQPFEPTPGEYVIGAWMKVDDPLASSPGRINVTIDGPSPVSYAFTPSGPIIDGWQRLEGTFTIAANATTITVQLKHLSGTAVNFDDLRIHPVLAGMTTTVYDPKSLLPLASHDGYNFTTFYNYDENLNLVRVRVETIEGIKTVSESEMGGYKQYK